MEFDNLTIEENVEETPSLEDALAELQAIEGNLPGPTVLLGLSGLDDVELHAFRTVWETLDVAQQRVLIQTMIDISEANFDLDYRSIGWMCLDEQDSEVRRSAIELLWEETSQQFLDKLVNMASTDATLAVRAEAMKALGNFVFMGEIGDLPSEAYENLLNFVLDVIESPKTEHVVYLRALEAIAHSSVDVVPSLIQKAYNSNDDDLKISAVIAMGNSCDERWQNEVLDELDHDDVDMVIEAAQSAGKLEINEAVPKLARLLTEPDRNLQVAVIEALGEIGGQEAIRILEHVQSMAEENEDDELAELVEEAVETASFLDGGFTLDDLAFDEAID